jgi:cell division protease FtsH
MGWLPAYRRVRGQVAFHEAGHVVPARRRGRRVKSATILPQGDIWGNVVYSGRSDASNSFSRYDFSRYVEDEIVILLAGATAEQRHTGARSGGDGDDYEEALDLAELLFGSTESARARVAELEAIADAELADAWDVVERIANRLIERLTLDAAEIAALLG